MNHAEYFEFVVKEFAPGLLRLGLQPSEAWYTVYGEHPQILTGCVAEDLATIQKILSSNDWNELREKLNGYVTGYAQKIIRATGGFQL